MFEIHCPTCDHDYIVGTASLTAFVNTDRGPIGRARCPLDHDVIVAFRAGPPGRTSAAAA